jgi:inosine/xanthosine triphosphatase
MKRIIVFVNSENPAKIEATREAFLKYFEDVEVKGIKIDSGISNQPIGYETFEGAEKRAMNLKRFCEENNLKADFFVGIEGGIININSKWFGFGTMCIISKEGYIGFSTSPLFQLPKIVIEELLKGKELGEVIDEIAKDKNTKQKYGAVGFFTKGRMNRKDLYVSGLTVALIPFLNKEFEF